MIDLAQAMAEFGLDYQDHRVDGYKNRAFTPGGLLIHHTASNRRNPMMNHKLYTAGRQGLPGPIVQVGLGRDNAVLLFSDGYCNHAGRASRKAVLETMRGNTVVADAAARSLKDSRWFSANKRLVGIEVDLDGIGEPLQIHRRRALVDLCAAICVHMGWHGGHATTHRHITTRKIDIYAPDFPTWDKFQHEINLRIAKHMQIELQAPGRFWTGGRWPGWVIKRDGSVVSKNGAPQLVKLSDILRPFGVTRPSSDITAAWWDEDLDLLVLKSEADGGTFALAVL